MKITHSGRVVDVNRQNQSVKINRDGGCPHARFFLNEKQFNFLEQLFFNSKGTGKDIRGVFIVDGRVLVKFKKEKGGAA